MKHISGRLIQWTERIQTQWSEKHHICASLTFIFPPAAIALVAMLIIRGISAVIQFFQHHYSQLILAALVLWTFAGWLDYHKAEKLKYKQTEQAIQERRNFVNRLEVAKTKNADYIMQAKILYYVSSGLGALGIVPPSMLKDLFSPARTVPVMDGAANLNLYLLQTDIQEIDTDLVQQTLQTKADQALMAGEFPGIPETFVFNGRAYSGFIVHLVRPSRSGSFLEVYTTLANDTYCRYVEDLALNGDALDLSVDRRDIFY